VHNNYFFLKKLSERLQERVTGWTIGSCFSQEKNELVIGLYSGNEEIYIKADQNPHFSCLSFPKSFSRARRNSIDLFPAMIDSQILKVLSYPFERAFSFVLDRDRMLLFKLYGNVSNMLLFEKGKCIDLFKHNLNDENKIKPEKLDRNIKVSMENFRKAGYDPKKMIPAIDQTIMDQLVKKGYNAKNEVGKWGLLKEMLWELKDPSYYTVSIQKEIKFRLFPEGEILQKSVDPIHAITNFYYARQKNHWLYQEQTKLLRILTLQFRKNQQYIIKAENKRDEWRSKLDYRQKADIIMANLHHIPPHSQEVDLFDFFHNEIVVIRLNPKLSPQKNAEQLYRKAKNQRKELEALENNLANKKRSAALLQKIIREVRNSNNLRSLKLINEKYRIDVAVEKKPETERFKTYEHMGFRILVGRNAKNNEELTFKYGYKDDLWFHAKDVSGSHVLIKYQAGKPFPKPVIEKAGQLAAYYSKNRNTSVCPVIYTEKKYVRKLKGAPPGMVRVEKENILFARPADHS
jgi:predicted ribosome quality control (RQC) complex YloA/Tae2 family protein